MYFELAGYNLKLPFKISDILICPSLGFLVFEWLFFFIEFTGPPSDSYL